MATREWKIGEFTLTIEGPDEVPLDVVMYARPGDAREFARCAEACGGVEKMSLPDHDYGFRSSASAYVLGEDGEPVFDAGARIEVYEPPRREQAKSDKPPAHPFFGPIKEQLTQATATAAGLGEADA